MFYLLPETKKLLLIANPKDAQAEAHNRFVMAIDRTDFQTVEAAIIQMIDSLVRHSKGFRLLSWNEDKTGWGSDGYAAPYIIDIYKAILGLLNVGMESRR